MIRRLDPLSWLLIAVVGWALACVVIAVSGFGGHAKLLPDDPALAPALPPIPKSAAGSGMGPLEVYAEAYNHPLFSLDRKPAAAHVPGKGGGGDHPLDVVLTSVIMTPSLQLAIVQDPKTHQSLRVREGQEIGGSYGGWKLTGLSPRSATFSSDAQGESTLDLRVFDGKGGEEPTRMGLTPQAIAAGVLGNLQPRPGPGDAPPQPTDDANKDDNGNEAATPDQSQIAANAAANAAAQSAQQQAEQIRRRIEERRQQALQKRQANEKDH